MEGEEVEQDIDVEGVEQEEEKTEEITTKEKEIKSKDEEVKKTEKPEGVEKKDHGGARPKTVQTVPVPFNTCTRSARKKEKDEIEKEGEKHIQHGVVGEGPPVTGLPAMGTPVTDKPGTGLPATGTPVTDKPGTGPPAMGMPVTDTPATGLPVKPTPKPKPKGGTPVKPKGSMSVKPKNKGK